MLQHIADREVLSEDDIALHIEAAYGDQRAENLFNLPRKEPEERNSGAGNAPTNRDSVKEALRWVLVKA